MRMLILDTTQFVIQNSNTLHIFGSLTDIELSLGGVLDLKYLYDHHVSFIGKSS